MKPKHFILPFSTIAMISSANAATVYATETFESGLGIWTANAVASTGLYEQNVSLQPASTTHNYSSSGGTHAASLGKSGGAITSTLTDLSSGGTTESLTVNFDFQLINGSTTRRGQIQYSNDGGTSWFGLARIQTGSGISNSTEYSGSVTITEGSTTVVRSSTLKALASGTNYDGSQFGSSSQFRFINNSSAGADARQFVDNIEITSTAAIPEPSTFALLGLGGLAFIMRKRR